VYAVNHLYLLELSQVHPRCYSPITADSSTSSSLAIVFLFNDFDHVVAWHSVAFLHNDASGSWRSPPLFDDNLRSPARPPRTPADLSYFLLPAAHTRPSPSSPVRVAPRPAHHDLFLARHGRCPSASKSAALGDRIYQPHYKKEAGHAA
jgi:hypothetical protein